MSIPISLSRVKKIENFIFADNHVSINSVPLSILTLYTKNQTCFAFDYLLRPTPLTKTGFPEEHLRTNRKNVWFFAYNLRMERGTVLIQTSFSARCQ